MKKIKPTDLIPQEIIENKILLIRGQKVMLDKDLAELYEVTTGNLNKAVKRNIERFPDDFMFQLTKQEVTNLIFQNGTSSWGGTRRLPYAFTEQGVAMLSSVLNSKRAILVNIQIMRIFTRLKSLLTTNEELRRKIEAIEKNFTSHDKQIQLIFEVIKQLLKPPELPEKPKRQIGFLAE